MKKRLLIIATSVMTLVAGAIIPLSSAQAISPDLVTCINLQNKAERISHTGKCLTTKEAQANWHKIISDSSLPDKATSKQITTCSNKDSSKYKYMLLKEKCSARQLRTDYYRSTVVASKPIILKVIATSHDSARVSIEQDLSANPDAPVAYYTINSSKGDSQKVFSRGELNLTIDKLSELTEYSFTVTATTADGTSPMSDVSDSVKTQKYVPIVIVKPSTAAPVAQVSLLSSDTAAVTIPAGATIVAVAAPSLLNPSISFGAQSSGISAVIQTTTNPASSGSTPFTVSGSTKIVDISITGLTGSATVCLDASSTAKIWHYENSNWVDITSSRTSTQVCGTTNTFSPFTSAERALTCAEGGTCVVGNTGPGGGIVFYVNANGFACGSGWTITGSPSGQKCKYLEAAPKTWYGGDADPVLQFSTLSDIPDATVNTMIAAGLENGWELISGSTVLNDIGRGFKNTVAIISTSSTNYPAANATRAYSGNGLTDWYLPNGKEIYQLCKWSAGKDWVSDTTACSPGIVASNPNKAGLQLSSYGSDGTIQSWTANGSYHTSFMVGNGRRHKVAMANGSNGTDIGENSQSYVRPIRAF